MPAAMTPVMKKKVNRNRMLRVACRLHSSQVSLDSLEEMSKARTLGRVLYGR